MSTVIWEDGATEAKISIAPGEEGWILEIVDFDGKSSMIEFDREDLADIGFNIMKFAYSIRSGI